MTASPQPTDGREALNVDLIAAAVHEGRFPDGKAAPNYCSFDDERDGGKEYCRRIARSVMAAQPISPQTKLVAAEKLAKRVLAYLEQPTGVPPSSKMECDCELYFLATDFLDAAPAALSAPRVEPVADAYAYIPDIVKNAMLTMWNYICDDSKHHPLDIEHGKNKVLTFEPKHWAQFTGDMVQRNIRDLFVAPPSQPDTGAREALERIINVPIGYHAASQMEAIARKALAAHPAPPDTVREDK